MSFHFEISCSNFIAFSQSNLDGFFHLDCDKLEQFLFDDNLVVKTEQEAFEALERWVMHSPMERLAKVPKLLPLIRLKRLEPSYLASTVNDFAVKSGCASLVESAIHHQSDRLNREENFAMEFQTKPRKSDTREIVETVAKVTKQSKQDDIYSVNTALSIGKIGKWGTASFTSMRSPSTQYEFPSSPEPHSSSSEQSTAELDTVLKPKKFFKSKNVFPFPTNHKTVAKISYAETSMTPNGQQHPAKRCAEELLLVSKEPYVKRFKTPAARKEYCYTDRNQLISSLNTAVAQAATAYQNVEQVNRESTSILSHLDAMMIEAREHIRLLT